MRICGVICEYNPFHSGHALHLREARRLSGAEVVVCVMSGHFTQRGDPAIADAWTRAKMALMGGADVVVQLPTLFAVRPAQRFAIGGVALLAALGCDTLAFGAEQADLSALCDAADRLALEDDAQRVLLREGLARGLSHPRARAIALGEPLSGALDIAQPNNALAISYLQALTALRAPMQPIAIARAGSGYHDARLTPLASATAIRAAISAGQWDALAEAMPETAYTLLRETRDAGRLHNPGALDTVLIAKLRAMPPDAIAALCDVTEGLEHRFAEAARKAGSREDLLARVKSKRYTHARLSRIACAALLNIPQALADTHPLPTYARVLGFRRDAAPLLRRWQDHADIPIITRAVDPRVKADPAFALDLAATDLWALGCANPAWRAAGLDYTTSPVIVE